jgi:hypothetical protein
VGSASDWSSSCGPESCGAHAPRAVTRSGCAALLLAHVYSGPVRSVSLVLAFGFVVILGLLVVLVLSGQADKQAVACFSLAFLGIGVAIGLGLSEKR